MEPQDTCGLFGKLPMQSDFISHFLPSALTDYWHGWLQSCLSVSQEQLAEQWRDYYLSAPIWRFAIMPGVVHNLGLMGVLIPSVDEVGRYFPLTIGHAGQHQPWAAYLEAKQWYDQAEHAALLALEDDMGYSQYMGYFEQLNVPEYPAASALVTESARTTRTYNTAFEHVDYDDPKPGALQLLDYNAQRMLGSYSLWWTEGSDSVVPCLLTCSGVPDSGQFAAMLDGQWQHWGWNHSMVAPN
jgi:type VI secretion system protein ImpM